MKKRPKFESWICIKEDVMGIGVFVVIDAKGSPWVSPVVVLKSLKDINNIIIFQKSKKIKEYGYI